MRGLDLGGLVHIDGTMVFINEQPFEPRLINLLLLYRFLAREHGGAVSFETRGLLGLMVRMRDGTEINIPNTEMQQGRDNLRYRNVLSFIGNEFGVKYTYKESCALIMRTGRLSGELVDGQWVIDTHTADTPV